MKFKPIGPYLLVKEIEEKEKTTKSGFVIQETKENTTRVLRGKVLKQGTGVMLNSGVRSEFNVKEGELVLFKEYAGNRFEYEGEEYLLLLEGDILGVI